MVKEISKVFTFAKFEDFQELENCFLYKHNQSSYVLVSPVEKILCPCDSSYRGKLDNVKVLLYEQLEGEFKQKSDFQAFTYKMLENSKIDEKYILDVIKRRYNYCLSVEKCLMNLKQYLEMCYKLKNSKENIKEHVDKLRALSLCPREDKKVIDAGDNRFIFVNKESKYYYCPFKLSEQEQKKYLDGLSDINCNVKSAKLNPVEKLAYVWVMYHTNSPFISEDKFYNDIENLRQEYTYLNRYDVED